MLRPALLLSHIGRCSRLRMSPALARIGGGRRQRSGDGFVMRTAGNDGVSLPHEGKSAEQELQEDLTVRETA